MKIIQTLTGIKVHSKKGKWLSFTHSHAVPNMFEFLFFYATQKKIYETVTMVLDNIGSH